MFNTQILAGSSGQGGETQQSLKFNDDESQYLSWTPAAAGNRKTWTWSGWVKRGNIGINSFIFGCGSSGTNFAFIGFSSDNTIDIRDYQGSYTYSSKTSQVFRDTSAFYHLVLVADMNNATSADRIKLYVNGERVTSFNSAPSPTTKDLVTNSAIQHVIGSGYYNDGSGVNNYLDGYLSDIYFIDGQALDASSFGQFTNGYWKKKDYSGTYGTNGFHLTFQDDVVSEGFNAVTYRGTGADQSISGLGFEPDLVWMKRRDTAVDHDLQDSVRGGGKTLMSQSAEPEFNLSGSFGISSFDSDGFSIISSGGRTNTSGGSYVAWAWDAGSGSPVSNTDGSITSTVKANPDYGFSIVSYTGLGSTETVGHGLSSAPELYIIKRRSAADAWNVYTTVIDGSLDFLNLNDDIAALNSSISLPTSTTFGVTSASTVGASGSTYIAYCFNSVAGYSSIGSYTGTGSNGNKITTGFAPAFILLKRTDAAGEDWLVYDNTRNPANLSGNEYVLRPNTSGAEQAYGSIDFESDGFTLQTVGGALNASGGTYIYMAFADTREAAFWKDVSGQGNHWTPNNLDYRDSLIDSPANNFATFNALNLPASAVLSEGNLKFTQTVNDRAAAGNMAISSGKWYFEVRYTAGTNPESGLAPISQSYANSGAVGSTDKLLFITNSGGMRTPAWSTTDTTGLSAQTGTTILGFAVDADNGKMFISVNGTYFNSGDPAAGTNPQATFDSDWLDQTGGGIVPFSGIYTGTSGEVKINFGQDSTFAGATTAGGNVDDNDIGDFAYAPPSGYLALCTANLPTPTIVDGSEHFNTVLYSGTGAAQSITGANHAPDLLWIKRRDAVNSHILYDSVRGDWELISNSTGAEFSSAGRIGSLDADGFTLENTTAGTLNASGGSYTSWLWKAGGTAVANTDGSITSQVSANVDAGFSVVSWTGNATTGATAGHGLSTKPSMVITKARTYANLWQVNLSSDVTGTAGYLNLDGTGAIATIYPYYYTSMNSSVLTFNGTTFDERYYNNRSGEDYIAYCFANTDTTKVGSYTGNSSSDGPFVYTGFRPAWILYKRTNDTGQWVIRDNKRDVDNPTEGRILANASDAEDVPAGSKLDFLSNGFKLRTNSFEMNNSSSTYIYLAFAENPFKYANAR